MGHRHSRDATTLRLVWILRVKEPLLVMSIQARVRQHQVDPHVTQGDDQERDPHDAPEAASLRRRILQSDHQCKATHLDVEGSLWKQTSVGPSGGVGPVGSIGMTLLNPVLWIRNPFGVKWDLIGEEKVEWGLLPCPAVPAVQSSIDVEALKRVLLELSESNKHSVDQDASGAASTSPFRQRVPPVTVRNRFTELAQEEIVDPESGGAFLQHEGEILTEPDTESCQEIGSEIPQSVDSYDWPASANN